MATGFILKRGGGGGGGGLTLTSTTVETYFTAVGSGSIVPGDFVRLANNRTTNQTNVLTNNTSFQNIPHRTLKVNETEYINVRPNGSSGFFINTYRLNTTTKVVTQVNVNVSIGVGQINNSDRFWDAIILGDGRLVIGYLGNSMNNTVEFLTCSLDTTTGSATLLTRTYFPSFDSTNSNSYAFRFAEVRNNIFAVTTTTYNGANPYVRLLQVDSGGTVSFLTPAFLIFGTSFNDAKAAYLSKIDDDRLLLTFIGGLGFTSANTGLGAVIIYTTNNILTMGSILQVNNTNTAPAQFVCVSARISIDQVALAWYAVFNGVPSVYRSILGFDGATLTLQGTAQLNNAEQLPWASQYYNSWQINISGWGHLNGTRQHLISTYLSPTYSSSVREVRVRLYNETNTLLNTQTASTSSNSFVFSANPGEAVYLPSINNVVGFFNAWDSTNSYMFRALVYYNLNDISVTKATVKNQIKGVAITAANQESLIQVVTLPGNP